MKLLTVVFGYNCFIYIDIPVAETYIIKQGSSVINSMGTLTKRVVLILSLSVILSGTIPIFIFWGIYFSSLRILFHSFWYFALVV